MTLAPSKRLVLLAMVVALSMPFAFANEKKKAEKAQKQEEKRQTIDRVEKETLVELFESSEDAKKLHGEAYAHAVFSNYKFQLIISGGGGQGVAVGPGGTRTYMKMGTGGIGLGIGGKKSSIVFLFENEKSFTSFVEKGWQADTQAGVAAGTAAADVEVTFKNGVAYYQLTQKGLIASADISGTKYWKSDDLND